MILCVTPNPALDRTLVVTHLQRGTDQRPTEVHVRAGGKGLNVARVVHSLGGAVQCAGLLGGYSGQLFANLAAQEGIAGDWTLFEGETRTCTIIVDQTTNQTTALYEAGDPVSTQAWTRFHAQVVQAAVQATVVAFCGSIPVSVEPRAFAALVADVGASGIPVWVDTSGPALEAALAAFPAGIKVNAAEASAVLALPISDQASALRAAQALRQRNSATIITLGEAGAVLFDGACGYGAVAPPVHAINTVGSGDAFFAGLLCEFARGASAEEYMRYAVACGAANACSTIGGYVEQRLLTQLLEQSRVWVLEG